MGSFGSYLHLADETGLVFVNWEGHAEHLIVHYPKVLSKLTEMQEILLTNVSKQCIDNMLKGLELWIEGGKQSKIRWGIFIFQKRLS
jgi:hypothetical protein